MKVFVTILLLINSSVSFAETTSDSKLIQNATYRGDMTTVGVPPGMPAFTVKFRRVQSALLKISKKDIEYKFSVDDPYGNKGKSAKLVITDYKGKNTYEGVWSLAATNDDSSRHSFLNRVLYNNYFVVNNDGSLECNACRNIGLPYVWRVSKSNKLGTSTSKSKNSTSLSFNDFKHGIFGIKYGTPPKKDMVYVDKNSSGKSVKWFKKKSGFRVEGIQLDNVFFGYSDKGFYSVIINVTGQKVNQVGGKISSRYGLASKSKNTAFSVSHLWRKKKFEITMDANYMRGANGSFMISHKE